MVIILKLDNINKQTTTPSNICTHTSTSMVFIKVNIFSVIRIAGKPTAPRLVKVLMVEEEDHCSQSEVKNWWKSTGIGMCQ